MARCPAVFSRVSAICVAVLLGVACVGTASAPDSGARIRFAVSRIGEVAVTGEGTFRGSATYALASAATVQSGQRYAGALLTLTASTTSLAPTPNPSMFGAPVTLAATVSPSMATGQVTFYDGTTVLGVSTLASGTATLETRLLPAGNRSLRAYYGGDASYAASTSGWVTQTVNAQPASSFLEAVNYEAGNSPFSVAVGDFNGDGKADLAVANYNSNNVSVLLGNGNGTFQAAVNYGAGTTPWSVAVGDFNGDGKADLAVANGGSDNVSVLLGNGNGTFQAAVNYGAGTGAVSVAVGDFNGDGKADLAVANINSANVSVLLGNGNGTFQAAVNYGAGASAVSVAVGDFNGDGKADLAVANYSSNNVNILLGTSALRFVPITPCRVADTRNAAGPFGGPALAANTARDFEIPAGSCGIPSTAAAYSFNVTVTPSASLLYLSMWPTGQPLPTVSTLNALDGRWTANAAIVPAGTNGSISVFASDPTHVILDINGYFVPPATSGALAFYPLTPCRVMDTRSGASIGAGGTLTVPVRSSSCSVPSGAVAYSLNFTALPHGPLGWITTWPTGAAMPTASTLNAPTGTITANAAILPAGTNGSVDVYASDATDLLVDINGYFAPPGTGGLSFYTLTPCRVADTRNADGPFGGPALLHTRDFAVPASACGVPSGAQAYSLNATVWPAGFLNWLTLWPTGGGMPVVSTLNSWDGRLVANAAIVPTTNGSISAYASDLTTFLFDINGYFAP